MRLLFVLFLAHIGCGDEAPVRAGPDARADAAARDAPVDAPAEPDAYVPRCFPQCFRMYEQCVDPDGPGGADPFCGCADDRACRGTGTCNPASGLCRCGPTAPCTGPTPLCVNGTCMGADGGL